MLWLLSQFGEPRNSRCTHSPHDTHALAPGDHASYFWPTAWEEHRIGWPLSAPSADAGLHSSGALLGNVPSSVRTCLYENKCKHYKQMHFANKWEHDKLSSLDKKMFFNVATKSEPLKLCKPNHLSAECKHLTENKVRTVCDWIAHSEYLLHSPALEFWKLSTSECPQFPPQSLPKCHPMGVKKHARIQVIVGNWSPSTRQHQFVHAVAPFSICQIHYHIFVAFDQGAKHRKSLLQPIPEYI